MITLRLLLALTIVALAAFGCGGDDPVAPAEPYSKVFIWAGTGLNAAGPDGLPPNETDLSLPYSLTFAPNGTPYILDWNSHRVRIVENGITRTFIGTGELGDARPGLASEIKLNHPTNVSFGPDGALYLCAWHNSKIMRMDLATGIIEDHCGDGSRAYGGDGGQAADAIVHLPVSLVWKDDGTAIFLDEVNQRIRKIDPQGIITTIAGTGEIGGSNDAEGIDALQASFKYPVGQMGWPSGKIDIDPEGRVYIPDALNNKVRVLDVDGKIYTLAGNGEPGFLGDGGPANLAQLRIPGAVTYGPDGNIYIADTFNHCVRRVLIGHDVEPAPGGIGLQHLSDAPIETVCGTCGSLGGEGGAGEHPLQTRLFSPTDIVFDADENMYIADQRNNRILVLPKNP